jgi:hypothetical protein
MKRGDLGYWEWRKNTGRPKNLKSPEQLWGLACDYFQMVDEMPAERQDFIRGGESAGRIITLENVQPYNWAGFEDFLSERAVIAKLDDYKSNKDNRYSEYADVIARIRNAMFDQKFRGAAVGAFKENIIARDLGLTDKTESTLIQEQPLFPDTP